MSRRQGTEDSGQRDGRKTVAGPQTTFLSSVLSLQSSEGGFSLVSAIFLLVVIAALGVFAVTLSTTQQQGSALDVMGARAYQAARAGIEWGAYQIAQSSVAGATFASNCQTGGALPQPGTLPGTLAGLTVTVGCSATPHDEGSRTISGGNPLWVYQLTSTASGVAGAVPGSPNYVERQMRAAITQ